jgi:hypothetical protein
MLFKQRPRGGVLSVIAGYAIRPWLLRRLAHSDLMTVPMPTLLSAPLVLALFAVGSAITSGDGRAQVVSLRRELPFSIVLTPVSSEVRAGVEVFVKVRVTNTSQRDIMGGGAFNANGLDMGFRYECRDAAGRLVEKEILLVGSIHDPPILKPGESRDEEPPISRACDLSQPGIYEIQLSRDVVKSPGFAN